MTKFNFNRDRVSLPLLQSAIFFIHKNEYEHGVTIANLLEAAVPNLVDRERFFVHDESFGGVIQDLRDGHGTLCAADERILAVIDYLQTPAIEPAAETVSPYATVYIASVDAIRDSINAALSGKSVRGRTSLFDDGCGFEWSSTEQGQDYWADRFGDRDEETPTDLSLADLQYMQALIDYVTAEEAEEVADYDYAAIEYSSLEAVTKGVTNVLNGDLTGIMSFEWGSTPQQKAENPDNPWTSDYWVDRFKGTVALTDEDYNFLRGFLEYLGEQQD